MYNSNGAVIGTATAGSMLAMTGPEQAWLVALGVALIAGGFLLGRYAGKRTAVAA